MEQAFLASQQKKFEGGYEIPSAYIRSGGKLEDDINKIGVTYDPLTSGSVVNPTAQLSYSFVSDDVSPLIQQKIEYCSKASLDELLRDQDPNLPFRCGWLYKKPANATSTYVEVNRGAYGRQEGPKDYSPASGEKWYWDLNAAKKVVMQDKCRSMTSCGMAGSDFYSGCGFAIDKSYGIPVDDYGKSLYDNTPAERIIVDSAKCPSTSTSAPDICKQLPNNTLERACIMRKVLDAGCSKEGTIYRALEGGSTSDYTRGIDSNKAYKVYQDRSKTALNAGMMRQGAVSAVDALKNFSGLRDEARSTANTGLAYAARDLCLNAGEIDRFDFCSEISMSTPGPYSIECLQKMFREKGGTAGGAWYPSSTTIEWYNTRFDNWGKIMAAIDSEISKMSSGKGNERVQAYRNIMGIGLEGVPLMRDGTPCKIETTSGRAISGPFIRGQMVDRLSECQQLCCGDAKCRGYNYIDNGGVQRECQLFSAVSGRNAQRNVVSGEKST